jgi:hypothetical protein
MLHGPLLIDPLVVVFMAPATIDLGSARSEAAPSSQGLA